MNLNVRLVLVKNLRCFRFSIKDSKMEEEKSALQKWLPSLKKPEYVGMPKTVWVDLGRIR